MCAVPSTLAAEPVRLNFNVTLGLVKGDMQGVFGEAVRVGDVLHGTLIYDPSAPGSIADPLYATYQPEGSITLDRGRGVSLPLESMNVVDDRWGRGYDTDYLAAGTSSFSASLPGFSWLKLTMEFYGPPGNRTGDALPQTAAELMSTYTLPATFDLQLNEDGVVPPWDDTTHRLAGRMSFGDPAPVPEPATLMLFATGAAGLLARRRRT
jgi:hypothetical protein